MWVAEMKRSHHPPRGIDILRLAGLSHHVLIRRTSLYFNTGSPTSYCVRVEELDPFCVSQYIGACDRYMCTHVYFKCTSATTLGLKIYSYVIRSKSMYKHTYWWNWLSLFLLLGWGPFSSKVQASLDINWGSKSMRWFTAYDVICVSTGEKVSLCWYKGKSLGMD